jgi:hypothetical protein
VYIFFGDETNTEPTRDVEFFIYGGVVLSGDQLVQVHEGIRRIRTGLGLTHSEPLKFAGSPKRISAQDHRAAKQEVLDLLRASGARFIAYCVHHRIVGQSISRRNEYALNTVLWGFHHFLAVEQDYGLAVLDRLRPQERLVVGRLNAEGLEMHDGRTVRMPRLVGIATAHIEWSHCLSACDVLLGAFRYCVNSPSTAAARAMFPAVADLLWYKPETEPRSVRVRATAASEDGDRARHQGTLRSARDFLPASVGRRVNARRGLVAQPEEHAVRGRLDA